MKTLSIRIHPRPLPRPDIKQFCIELDNKIECFHRSDNPIAVKRRVRLEKMNRSYFDECALPVALFGLNALFAAATWDWSLVPFYYNVMAPFCLLFWQVMDMCQVLILLAPLLLVRWVLAMVKKAVQHGNN